MAAKKLYVALNDDSGESPTGDDVCGTLQGELDEIQANADSSEEETYTVYELVPVKKVKTGTLTVTDVKTGKITNKKDKLY